MRSRSFIFALVLFVLLGSMGKNVHAFGKGEIIAFAKIQDMPVRDVPLTLYRVGTRTDGIWSLDPKYGSLDLKLDFVNTEVQKENARRLYEYLLRTGEQGSEGITGANGEAAWRNLDTDAIYLLAQTRAIEIDEKKYISAPLLVTLPTVIEGTACNNLEIDLKFQAVPPTPTPTPTPVPMPGNDKAQISVTKQIFVMNEDLQWIPAHAKDRTYYVGLFMDKEGTVPYPGEAVKAISVRDSASGTAVFQELPPGTYYVYETDENGNIIWPDELREDEPDNTWMCVIGEIDNSVSNKIVLDQGGLRKDITISNLYYHTPDDFYITGRLKITKKVLKNGEETTVNDTFYAGIFREDETLDLVQEMALQQNGTVSLEVKLGGENGTEPVNYLVMETDGNGNPVDKAVFPYIVTGEGKVNLSMSRTEQAVTITNKIPDAPSQTVTPQPKAPTSTPGAGGNPGGPAIGNPTGSTSSHNVKTGDDTPVLPLLILLVVSTGVILMIKRKREKEREQR